MQSLLEVVGRSILTEESDVKMKGIGSILGSLSPGVLAGLPVEATKAEWSVVNVNGIEKLVRTFEFKDSRRVKDFVTHLIFEQDEMQHHCRMILDANSVTIETYTHNVDAITELDKELAKFCDDLYRDIQDFYDDVKGEHR
jgi:4a-hydroxytetrahydrobiopterin dehydratase